MSEQQLMDCVVGTKSRPGLARVLGWRCAHFRPAMTSRGMRTAVSADGAGFPDLVLLRDNSQIVVELKSAVGRLTSEQQAWLEAFHEAGVDAFVWRPEHWHNGDIERALSR
jgi:hypothetical protein